MKVLKEKITAVSKDATLSNDSKAEKIKEYNEKIASAKKKCAETTAVLRAETKDDAAKAKQRFAK